MSKLSIGSTVLRELARWGSLTGAFFLLIFFIYNNVLQTSATVTNNGVFFYGDTSATTQGVLRARTFTSPATANAEINGATASSTSFIVWTIAKTATTREEMMIGTLKVNGTLDIQTCATGCDANGDYTARWNNAGTSVTQQCDTTPVASECIRPFDIAYESLSGHGFVVYGDNSADNAYYARWDGSAWSPNTTPGTPGATNLLNLPGTGGTPEWIRVIPAGENLDQERSNRMMVLIADTNDDLHAFYWNGSSFDSGTTLLTDLQNCSLAQCFDGSWQDINDFVVAYHDADATNDVRYNTYVVGTGWGTETQAFTTAATGKWVMSTADPTSSRVMVSIADNGNDARNAVWRGDNSTDGWTVGCTDTTIETVSGMQAYAAFERFNGEALHIFNDSGTTNTGDYCTYTPPSTWGAATASGLTTGDDSEKTKAWGSPNNDDIMMVSQDVDCDTDAKLWTGAGWDANMASIEVDNSHYGVACPNNTAPQTSPEGAAYSYDFAWKMFTPWQRNWRFYDGTDTASTPTTALANENTTPTNFVPTGGTFRLRANYAERGAQSATDSRRKLQYTSGCNPNSALEVTCTWTDVDDPGGTGIWRYKDITCSATDCADGTTLIATVLTGSSTCTAGNGCGTWIMDKDAAAATTMDHNASQVQESEWVVEGNFAAENTTYYFRVWDVEQETPIYREQDSGDCGSGGASTCTYPSVTTGLRTAPLMDQVMRHGNWFNTAGTEQFFYWAN